MSGGRRTDLGPVLDQENAAGLYASRRKWRRENRAAVVVEWPIEPTCLEHPSSLEPDVARGGLPLKVGIWDSDF